MKVTSIDINLNCILEDFKKKFNKDGFFIVRNFFHSRVIDDLSKKINKIMMGQCKIDYSKIWMQLDSESGLYSDLNFGGFGFKGATFNYRKIEGLEEDKLFFDIFTKPFFVEICRVIYGLNRPIKCFRTMFMNKPANKGTWLPWHQDRWNYLNKNPLVTVWMPLDTSSKENGCVQIIRGSHHYGLINPEHESGFLTEEQSKNYTIGKEIIYLELKPGDLAILHNHLLHASDINTTDSPRRALSICYMDGNTKHKIESEKKYTFLFNT